MPLESATFISQLVASNPPGTDPEAQGDDHLRLIKAVLQSTFPATGKAFRFPVSVAAVAGNYNVHVTDDQSKVVPVDATGGVRTVNLPAAPADGYTVLIVKVDSSANGVVVDGAGSDTISGNTTITLTRQWQALMVQYSATASPVSWFGFLWSKDDFHTLLANLNTNGFNLRFNDNKGATDDVGNETLMFRKVASAVNQLEVTNAATGAPPIVGAAGDDTNIGIEFKPKGSGPLTRTGGHVLWDHNNAGGRIAALTEKTTPVAADQFLLADSADANNPKRVAHNNIGPVKWIESGSVTSVANKDFTIPAGIDELVLTLIGFRPAADAQFWLRVSQSGTFLTGASDYIWGLQAAGVNQNNDSDSKIVLTNTVDGNSTSSLDLLTISVYRPSAASFPKFVEQRGFEYNPGGSGEAIQGGGRLKANDSAIDGIRILCSGAINIAEMYWTIRGYKYS